MMRFPFKKKMVPEILTPLDGYNRWAASYQNESNPIKKYSDTLIESLLPDLTNKIALDVGCGTGYFCSLAERQNATSVTGIDLSPEMIERARNNCSYTTFRCEDIRDVNFENESFDLIISALVFGHIEALNPTLNNLLKAIKPNGTILISDFHPSLSLKGLRRTFTDPDSKNTYEIKHYIHTLAEYEESLSLHNFQLTNFKEPEWNGEPVIFALEGIKQSL